MDNYYKKDNVWNNSLFGFDYCFCGSNCKHYECGRNTNSKSYKAMLKHEPIHSLADFSNNCKNYWRKRKEEDKWTSQT